MYACTHYVPLNLEYMLFEPSCSMIPWVLVCVPPWVFDAWLSWVPLVSYTNFSFFLVLVASGWSRDVRNPPQPCLPPLPIGMDGSSILLYASHSFSFWHCLFLLPGIYFEDAQFVYRFYIWRLFFIVKILSSVHLLVE